MKRTMFLAPLALFAAAAPCSAELVHLQVELTGTGTGAFWGYEPGMPPYEPPPYFSRVVIEAIVDTDEQFNYMGNNAGEVRFYDFDDPDHVFWWAPNGGLIYDVWLRRLENGDGPYYELDVEIDGPDTIYGAGAYYTTYVFPAEGFFTGPTEGAPGTFLAENGLVYYNDIGPQGIGHYTLDSVIATPTPIPEPAAIVSLAAVGLLLRRRR